MNDRSYSGYSKTLALIAALLMAGCVPPQAPVAPQSQGQYSEGSSASSSGNTSQASDEGFELELNEAGSSGNTTQP